MVGRGRIFFFHYNINIFTFSSRQIDFVAIKSKQNDFWIFYWMLFVLQIKYKLFLTKLWSPGDLSAWRLVTSPTTSPA